MSFAFVYAAGFALCVADVVVLVSWMNKNLQNRQVHVELGMLPALLPALAGFAVFPGMNVLVGVAGAILLAYNRPAWVEVDRG